MRALKIVGIIVLAVIVILAILGLVAPAEYQVKRSVVIDAPKDVVFRNIKYWQRWSAWSPWKDRDPSMQVTVEGIDGEVGSMYLWEGDPDITGTGRMTNTGITEGEELKYKLNFTEPWENEAGGYVRVDDVDGKTEATWTISGESPFPWNIFLLFMNMDKSIGTDFEEGLGMLKTISEKQAAEIEKYKIRKTLFPTTNYAAIRNVVSFEDMPQFFSDSYEAIQKAVRNKNRRITGPPVGLFYDYSEQEMKSDAAAGIPIRGTISSDRVTTLTVPRDSAYYVDYYGAYTGSYFAHEAIDLYLQRNNLNRKPPVIEEYITEPAQEADTSKWHTKIYYFAD